jgi:hypothetical protein
VKARLSAPAALGAAAALAWLALALNQRAEWPRVGFIALGVALVAALLLRRVAALVPRAVLALPRPVFVGVCALAAAGISGWATHAAMRDQPLSIDAGVYLMQARAMAHGHLGLLAQHPIQAFGDRFMLEGPDGEQYGIFPPGWPLAIVPFLLVGMPMLVGPAVAIALVFSQAALGRAVGRASGDEDAGELATRVSLLLSLASIGRALETADLLSHAFVAVLATLAIAGALNLGTRGSSARASRAWSLAVGACVGWVLASRLLDGVVLGAAVAGVLVWRRPSLATLGWLAAGATPFLLLLAVEQHAATGSWLTPTQTLYFARSDWPPTCHRLGFGPDVGCTVEHPGPTRELGGDGYDLRDALRVTRERAGALGEDLLGWGPLLLAAFVPLVAFASAADAVAVAFVLALTLAYGLFYYGNAMFFDARHLFPAAAFVWLLVARATSLAKSPVVRGVGVVCALAVAVAGVWSPWKTRVAGAADFQSTRSDLRRSFAKHDVAAGILKTHDLTSFASAFDPWARDTQRLIALDDGAGLVELRRAHPELPVLISLPNDDVGRMYLAAPAPGVSVELERSWPVFVRPHGLGTRQQSQEGASGGTVLWLSHASVGASVDIAFETSTPGIYALRVDSWAGPDEGDYALELDGAPLLELHGYARGRRALRGAPTTRTLDAGLHVLVARCTGQSDASTGYDARLDALVGEPAPAEPVTP